jgi:predicted MFS family arabinose efflux permease
VTSGFWRSARLASGSACALGLGRFAYGLVLPAMTEHLDWNLAEAGTMTTANGIGYLAGALATPAVAGRLGLATTFRLGMVLCTISLTATATSADFLALSAGRAVTGFAGALVFIAGAVLCPGTVYFAGTGVGIVFSGVLLPPLLDQHPQRWPLAWIALAAAAAISTAVSWTAVGSSRPPPAAPRAGSRPTRLWPAALAYLLFAAGYIAYITFLSANLATRHASTGETVVTWSMLGCAVVAAPSLWQRPIARRPDGRIVAVLLAILAVASLAALVTPEPAVAVASALAYGATFMAVPAAITALVRAAAAPERLTGTVARFTVVFAIGQTAGPWIAGFLADRTATGATLVWTAALCGSGAVVAMLSAPEHGPRAS